MTGEQIRRWSDELAREPGSLAFMPLADALRRHGQHADALSVARRGLERHPYLAEAHDVLARVYADAGEDQRARDEWETALRLEPSHPASLKGLGFLAFARGDLTTAERMLRLALARDERDPALVDAHRRVRERLEGSRDAALENGSAHHPRPEAPAAANARTLFASLLGDGDRTALLVDQDGLVLAGSYVDELGREVGDEIGAELSGIADEATRALAHLGLGLWDGMLVEAQHATVALGPTREGAVVLVAAARDTSIGFVRRLLDRARRSALDWLKAVA